MYLSLIQQAVRSRAMLIGPHALTVAGSDQGTIQEVWNGVLSQSADSVIRSSVEEISHDT